jgi:hypothetical protein
MPIDARSFIIGRIVESFSSIRSCSYEQLRPYVTDLCNLLKCEDLSDEEWKFVLKYTRFMDGQILTLRSRGWRDEII